MSAYAVTGINEDGIPYATGFIVECSGGYMLLDDTLCLLSRSVFPRLSVHNEITVRDRKGNAVIFPLKRQRLRIAEMR